MKTLLFLVSLLVFSTQSFSSEQSLEFSPLQQQFLHPCDFRENIDQCGVDYGLYDFNAQTAQQLMDGRAIEDFIYDLLKGLKLKKSQRKKFISHLGEEFKLKDQKKLDFKIKLFATGIQYSFYDEEIYILTTYNGEIVGFYIDTDSMEKPIRNGRYMPAYSHFISGDSNSYKCMKIFDTKESYFACNFVYDTE